MESFRDAAATMSNLPETVYLETEFVPLAMLQRFQKYFPVTNVLSLDLQLMAVRSIKSDYELSLMIESGKIHQRVQEELIPPILREGINEVDFSTDLYSLMMKEGYHGISAIQYVRYRSCTGTNRFR